MMFVFMMEQWLSAYNCSNHSCNSCAQDPLCKMLYRFSERYVNMSKCKLLDDLLFLR